MSEQDIDHAPHYPKQWHDVHELETAIFLHSEWLRNLHRTLICGNQPNPADLQPDAHRCCNFGKWYYEAESENFLARESFLELGNTHKLMHDYARDLLMTRAQGKSADPDLYDRFIGQSQLFTIEMRALQFEILEEHYDTDPLTDTLSRRTMHMHLEQEFARAKRSDKPCVICMLDFDNFKGINDGYGHQVGDDVLRIGAQRIKSVLRTYDSIFRYGGEEFLVCLPETDINSARDIAERMRETLAESPIEAHNGVSIPVTASFGLASSEFNTNIKDTIAFADQALLEAKSLGKNQVHLWH